MYRRVAAVLFPVTLIALVATAVWGYQENQDKNSILIKAENQYQRAFHDLNYHMDKLQDEIGKTLALNSRSQLSNCMTNVWRLAYASQSDLGQLPMTLMPFDKAEKFVHNTGQFSYKVGVRDLEKEPLTDKEWNTLQTLYNRSQEITRDLHKVQTVTLNKNLRWMDVEMALASEDKQMDNTIIDGFKKVNERVEQYPEVDWGPTINNMEVRKREKAQRLQGKNITPAEAKRKTAQVLGRPSTRGMSVTLNKKGDYQTYSVRFTKDRNQEVYADLTTKGGYMVWMDYDRPVKQSKLSLEQAQARASGFLRRIGYKNMVPISYDDVGNITTFNFVHRENGVYIYPETVTVKVAMDNGEIMGLQADEYVFNKISRRSFKPRLTEAEAKKEVSPRLKVQKSNLAVIYNEAGDEVLCYEFLGNIGKDQYRLFINANTGDEEFIEKIKKGDADQV
ncbi:germination protein YpeB [Paenactinomyces guangxiensis]|uniref:Germination protein YpeB n=1 Tax=Paenactinomyces guangxiensis TaxID=1490290 RepID=A0A7W1WT76_9BACL|nr:germination protein YpeB [Paenactinomyces guangxiensis]MBA4495625.1 germination protein YpeB [Paenactinomyces guangxiensis]MBH8592613.1 germination protein YpeB [Paenactinomyces guangxiensis]